MISHYYDTGCSGKIVFFPIHYCLAYISLHGIFKVLDAVRVYSLSYWLAISWTTISSPVLAKERLQNTREILEKENIYSEHPVDSIFLII